MAQLHIYMAQFPWLLLSPCWVPFVSPLHPLLLTWHPPSCDRNRPPRSQVACKLTPFAPPFIQPTRSLQIPRTPTAPRLTKTTSGIFRLLLSGTFTSCFVVFHHPVDKKGVYPYNWKSGGCGELPMPLETVKPFRRTLVTLCSTCI